MIGAHVDLAFALPSLARDDARGRAYGTADGAQQRPGPVAPQMRNTTQDVEGLHDQSVAHEQSKGLTECAMDRCAAATGVRIVKARQIVVYERRRMQQFDRSRSRIRQRGLRIPAGQRHRQTQPWTDAVSRGKTA